MFRNALLSVLFVLLLAPAARAFEECRFAFDLDTQSSALQSLVEEAATRGGFWRPIGEAPDDVQEIARFVGRLDVCLRTVDGKPRTIILDGTPFVIESPHVSQCTAALLPGNRLLTNRHCFFEPELMEAGFTLVDQVRVNFGYTSRDFTQNVRTFLVANRELADSRDLDALVLQIIGGDANAVLGGHIPMRMEPDAAPRRALTMIHHPRGEPLQFSAGTCQIDSRQAELPAEVSLIRHRCESAGGSSGALLLDARTLAVVGLHNTGGLGGSTGYNGGHKIAMIEAALNLGFTAAAAPVTVPLPPSLETIEAANAALFDALLDPDPGRSRAALQEVIARFPGTTAATRASAALDRLASATPPVITLPVVAPRNETTSTALSVRPDGTGDYRSIAEAVAAATPGARIEVFPGTYQGGVDVDKPLDIIGIGDRAQILWEAEGDDVIYWTAPSGRIANLTLRQTGGNFYGVDFHGGTAVLEDNDITSLGLNIIAIRDGADPVVRRNLIRDGATHGIFIYDDGKGTVEANEIYGNTNTGLIIEESDPVVRKNVIRNNGEAGILVQKTATGTITENDIHSNGFAGIEITSLADPLIRDNDIHDGTQAGIFIHTDGKGRIERNEIHGNGFSGIMIEAADPVIRGNVIRDGKQAGILIEGAARGTIEQNEITGNALTGIEITDGANPVIDGNVISRNVFEAIWIYDGGRGRIVNNDLRFNKRGAFDIEESAGKIGLRNNTE